MTKDKELNKLYREILGDMMSKSWRDAIRLLSSLRAEYRKRLKKVRKEMKNLSEQEKGRPTTPKLHAG